MHELKGGILNKCFLAIVFSKSSVSVVLFKNASSVFEFAIPSVLYCFFEEGLMHYVQKEGENDYLVNFSRGYEVKQLSFNRTVSNHYSSSSYKKLFCCINNKHWNNFQFKSWSKPLSYLHYELCSYRSEGN